MTKRSPTESEADDDGFSTDFTPWVPDRRRASGWTEARQRAFIAALAKCGVVADAAKSVGLSARSAYQLREKIGAGSFDAAWESAQAFALTIAAGNVLDVALNGETVPIIRNNKVIGERRKFVASRQLRIFNAVGRHVATNAAAERKRAAEDREWRRDAARHRREWDEADSAEAAERRQRDKDGKKWLQKAQTKRIREAARNPAPPPGPRIRPL